MMVFIASVATVAAALTVVAQSAPPSGAADRPPASTKPATTQPAENDEETVEPPAAPSPADILRALTKPEDAPPKPVILPAQPGQTIRRKEVDPSALPPNAVAPIAAKLYPDGYRIVDRPGRLAREGDYYVFAFESRGRGEIEPPIRLLPNRLLEDMEIISAGATKPVVFLISGELTEYHGINYLLIQKLLTRPEMGNFK